MCTIRGPVGPPLSVGTKISDQPLNAIKHRRMKNYSGRQLDAERTYRRALDISRTDETDNAIQPALLLKYAGALHEVGRSAEAADYAERASARAGQAGDQMILDQADSLKA